MALLSVRCIALIRDAASILPKDAKNRMRVSFLAILQTIKRQAENYEVNLEIDQSIQGWTHVLGEADAHLFASKLKGALAEARVCETFTAVEDGRLEAYDYVIRLAGLQTCICPVCHKNLDAPSREVRDLWADAGCPTCVATGKNKSQARVSQSPDEPLTMFCPACKSWKPAPNQTTLEFLVSIDQCSDCYEHYMALKDPGIYPPVVPDDGDLFWELPILIGKDGFTAIPLDDRRCQRIRQAAAIGPVFDRDDRSRDSEYRQLNRAMRAVKQAASLEQAVQAIDLSLVNLPEFRAWFRQEVAPIVRDAEVRVDELPPASRRDAYWVAAARILSYTFCLCGQPDIALSG